MATPLLTTKLYIPPPRSDHVSRPRLIEQLDAGLARKLSLISAPAGFGKTTLLSNWVEKLDLPVAWISLDERDNDRTRFLVYFVAALQTIDASIGETVKAMLNVPQPPPIESVMTELINEVAAIEQSFVLILDDYHVLGDQEVHDAFNFLLDHLPPKMHLVIASRSDPLLQIPSLRAKGQITELRSDNLRFTTQEATKFLNEVMGLELSLDDVLSLETRTEGWIVGLHLAALSIQDSDDVERFISAFTGDNRYIVDYLVDEVLAQRPTGTKDFLLQTSILNRMSGSLCETITGQEGGQEMLERLDQANLFIVPLDNERCWYRYHHLFSDLLRVRLNQSLARDEIGSVAELHIRASEWYEENGYLGESFHHAVTAEDFERAAALAEQAWQAMDLSYQSAAWLGWVKKLPDELVRTRPLLSTQYAWALIDASELEEVDSRLRDAERWLETMGDDSARVDSSGRGKAEFYEEQYRTLPVRIALARAFKSQAIGEVSNTVKHAQLALKLAAEEDHLSRSQATVMLGLTYWVSGDLEAAHKAMDNWVKSMQKASNFVLAVASTHALADIMVAQGRLQDALRTYQNSTELASEQDEYVKRVTVHLNLGLAMLYHEMGNEEAATRHMEISRKQGEQTPLIDWPFRWRLAQARLKEARGDLESALDLLDEARHLQVQVTLPDIRPIEALKARIYIKQGRLTQAQDWVRERDLSVDDQLTYLGEFEHITLARMLMAEYQRDQTERSILEATGLLERLLKAAEEGRRMNSVIEILVLQALVHQAQNDSIIALASLERALILAKPENYVRIFVDEGPPMAALLRKALDRNNVSDYVRRLLAAFPIADWQQAVTPQEQAIKSEIVEPLSEREIEVLQLISEGMTNPEIAARLYISLNTVKAHTRNINGKLGVNNRMQATVKARTLGMLPAN
jgi:LuxR family maltose regulon positive regulatory protein